MRHLIFFFIASVATGFACSSSSNPGSSSGDCGPHDVTRLGPTTCTPNSIEGICTRSLGDNAASEEPVCAAGPDGAMYLIEVDGDTYLSGDGWAFGPREFGAEGTKTYAVEPDSLSAADETRCQTALSLCSSGSPIESGTGDDARSD